jgi:hypothetical protein
LHPGLRRDDEKAASIAAPVGGVAAPGVADRRAAPYGDASGYSDALLGIFDPIAPAAAAALTALAAGDRAMFDAILAPTVPLSRHVFGAPTRFYKTGVVFLAWLNGRQNHFVMVGGQQSARNLLHLVELFRLADVAGLLCDPALARDRMQTLLALHGAGS